jgi:succinyl-CoA synthetase alpha subunit
VISEKRFGEYVRLFEMDNETWAVVLLGEIAGNVELVGEVL